MKRVLTNKRAGNVARNQTVATAFHHLWSAIDALRNRFSLITGHHLRINYQLRCDILSK